MTFRNVLVATDLEDAGDPALEEAAGLAARFGAVLHLLHVVTEPMKEPWSGFSPAAAYLAEIDAHKAGALRRLNRLADRVGAAPAGVDVAVRVGDPAEAILQYATDHDIDLIVCGTHGRRGLDRLVMGSVAERVVRLAPCAVLTVGPRRAEPAAAA